MAAITWNPSDKSSKLTLSNNNLTMTSINGSASIRSTKSKSTGKLYFEIKCDSGDYFDSCGVMGSGDSLDATVGQSTTGWGCDGSYKGYNSGGTATDASAFAIGDVVGVAVDFTSGKIWWAINNTWIDSGNPATGANPMFTGLSGALFAANSSVYGSIVSTVNFGASAFNYTPPSGFSAYDIVIPSEHITRVSVRQTNFYNNFPLLGGV